MNSHQDMAAPRLSFLLSVPTQPRYHKRISGLQKQGVEAKVYAFERDYLQNRPEGLSYISLGYIQHRNYARRMLPLLKSLPVIRRSLKQANVIYCFGLDMLVLGALSRLLLRRPPVLVYECADVRPIMAGNGWSSRLMRWLERISLRAASLIVVTSPAFIDRYFKPLQGQPDAKFMLIENKLPVAMARKPTLPPWEGQRPLRIGYFGLLRDPPSWQILRTLAQNYPDRFEIVVYGHLMQVPGFVEDVANLTNMRYAGEYAYPQDLPTMYGSVDLCWACYQKTSESRIRDVWQWARTNRFYEAVFFQTPLVTQLNSQDGERVRDYQIGIEVDTDRPEEAIQAILDITPERLDSWRAVLATLPIDVSVHNTEHAELLVHIQACVSGDKHL